MDFNEGGKTPEILMNNTTKPIKDIPKRPEVKVPSIIEMSKDDLIEFAANRLIAMPFNLHKFTKDEVYRTAYLIEFIRGVAAYSMLGFRDIHFPVEQFMKDADERLKKAAIKEKILRG